MITGLILIRGTYIRGAYIWVGLFSGGAYIRGGGAYIWNEVISVSTCGGLIHRGGLYSGQGCKLLSDIGQCPTKFGKCPSKSNFEQKKLSHYTFFAVTKSDCKLHFAIKFARYSSILLNVVLEWLYILVS